MSLAQVSRIFAEHCKNAWDHDQGKHRMCFSDEHYMSTMLAWKGMEDQTDCRVRLPGACTQCLNLRWCVYPLHAVHRQGDSASTCDDARLPGPLVDIIPGRECIGLPCSTLQGRIFDQVHKWHLGLRSTAAVDAKRQLSRL